MPFKVVPGVVTGVVTATVPGVVTATVPGVVTGVITATVPGVVTATDQFPSAAIEIALSQHTRGHCYDYSTQVSKSIY